MAIQLSQAAASAMADALDAYINTGGIGKIIIYGGSVPANANATASATVLATFDSVGSVVANPMFGNASNGVITLANTPMTKAASATGTATHFRIYQTNGTTVALQGTVGTSSADLILNTVSLTSGVNVTITSGTLTVPV